MTLESFIGSILACIHHAIKFGVLFTAANGSPFLRVNPFLKDEEVPKVHSTDLGVPGETSFTRARISICTE